MPDEPTLSTPFEIIGLRGTTKTTLSNKFKGLRPRLLNVGMNTGLSNFQTVTEFFALNPLTDYFTESHGDFEQIHEGSSQNRFVSLLTS
jgi:hypothetical protein